MAFASWFDLEETQRGELRRAAAGASASPAEQSGGRHGSSPHRAGVSVDDASLARGGAFNHAAPPKRYTSAVLRGRVGDSESHTTPPQASGLTPVDEDGAGLRVPRGLKLTIPVSDANSGPGSVVVAQVQTGGGPYRSVLSFFPLLGSPPVSPRSVPPPLGTPPPPFPPLGLGP